MALHLNGKDALAAAIKAAGDKLIVIDFFATWCGPCRTIAPVIDKMVTEYSDVTFIKIDVDENEAVAEEYGISVMPTFIFLKKGQKLGEMTGANEANLKSNVEKYRTQ